MSEKIGMLLTFAGCALFSLVQAQGSEETGRIELPNGMVVRPYAYGHFVAGQLVSGNLKSTDISTNNSSYAIDHVWTENTHVAFGLDTRYLDHVRMKFGLSTTLYFSYPQFMQHDRYTKNLRQDVAIDDAFVQFYRGDEANPTFFARIGYFKYQYNSDVRNLGEYLFRTGTYPAFIDNSFDFPMRRLLGFQVEANFLKNTLSSDLLFISQTVFPAMNWSLAGLLKYDLLGLHCLNIGAGIDFAHLFDVYTDHSYPADGGDPTQMKSSVNAQYIKEITAAGDTIKEYYTFKGTKVMGYINFDPKAIVPMKFLGDNDLKLYAEFCIVGLKNYPDSAYLGGSPQLSLVAPSYDQRSERTPIAIGFNFPAFKLLDVLSVEMEIFTAKYYNDASYYINKGSAPLPNDVTSMMTDPNAPKKSDIKWSVYAKRSFFSNHFSVIGQMARDHTRLGCAAYDYEYWNDLLVTDKDWWWALKTSWQF